VNPAFRTRPWGRRGERLSGEFQRLPPDRRLFRLLGLVGRSLDFTFRLRPRLGRPNVVDVRGIRALSLPQVFNPAWFVTSPILIDVIAALRIPPASHVLELCCGTGVGAIALVRAGVRSVTAVDINPIAVHCARINIRRNRATSHIRLLQGDLYHPVEDARFDWIIANPPYLDGHPRTWLERAFLGGRKGEVLSRIVEGLDRHLCPGGRAVLTYSTVAPSGRIEALVQGVGFRIVKVINHDLGFEVVSHFVIARG